MKTKILRAWLLVGLGLGSCQVELDNFFGNGNTGGYPDVDEALWPYFQRFEDEAAARGLKVDLADAYITGYLSDISTSQVIGQCSYSSNNPHRVTIDKPFWNQASDLAREFVVFHELGHCYLDRVHDESMDARGICLSIMRSGSGTCRDIYNAATRSGLVSELFAEKD